MLCAMDLAHLRREYEDRGIDAGDVDPDPIAQVRLWLADAQAVGVFEANAMVLSTADPEGRPSGRFVLLKGLDERGFAFFTNFESAKARDLDQVGLAALTFGWLELHRQVRVQGSVERLSDEESDAYFASRPQGAQIGAWASPQSHVLEDRAELDRHVGEILARFREDEVPRPPFWGGYLVRPDTIELWQGRANRLHDRLRYRREDEDWVIERLAP
jgi:pyridoxamine 5'-phosphate oxidase